MRKPQTVQLKYTSTDSRILESLVTRSRKVYLQPHRVAYAFREQLRRSSFQPPAKPKLGIRTTDNHDWTSTALRKFPRENTTPKHYVHPRLSFRPSCTFAYRCRRLYLPCTPAHSDHRQTTINITSALCRVSSIQHRLRASSGRCAAGASNLGRGRRPQPRQDIHSIGYAERERERESAVIGLVLPV